MNWIVVSFVLTSLISWFAVVRYDIQMFQQNSYRYSRYWTWLKNGNILRHDRWFFLFMTAWWVLSWNAGSTWMASIALLILAFKEFRTSLLLRQPNPRLQRRQRIQHPPTKRHHRPRLHRRLPRRHQSLGRWRRIRYRYHISNKVILKVAIRLCNV